VPATRLEAITPRRAIKNCQVKPLINLGYVALLCPERERKVHVGVLSDCDAARKMKDLWPFEVALRGEASNHLMLRWLKTVVVSDEEKAPVRGVRWGSGRRAEAIR
jgi:hypothetical protein